MNTFVLWQCCKYEYMQKILCKICGCCSKCFVHRCHCSITENWFGLEKIVFANAQYWIYLSSAESAAQIKGSEPRLLRPVRGTVTWVFHSTVCHHNSVMTVIRRTFLNRWVLCMPRVFRVVSKTLEKIWNCSIAVLIEQRWWLRIVDIWRLSWKNVAQFTCDIRRYKLCVRWMQLWTYSGLASLTKSTILSQVEM